jgi:hypothetical protein
MMCRMIGLPPISIMGLGRTAVSSEIRAPGQNDDLHAIAAASKAPSGANQRVTRPNSGGQRASAPPILQEAQLFPNVNATSRWGTVQNVARANVPRAAEQVNLREVLQRCSAR